MKTDPARRCLVAFDVGIGRTCTALAVVAWRSAERARRPRAAPEFDVDAARAGAGEQDPEQA